MSIVQVNNNSADIPEMIVHWAKCLGRSLPRRRVFDQINSGKRAVWSAQEIADRTKLPLKTVLDEGKRLVVGELILQEDGFPVHYRKRPVVQRHKKSIKKAAESEKERGKITTVRNPKVNVSVTPAPGRIAKARFVAPGRFRQFSKMSGISAASVKKSISMVPLSEEAFKLSVIKIIGEPFELKDWGGEQLDIFSTRPQLQGKRRPTGFALKGPGSAQGVLTPAKMGKNGDQLQRLIDDSVEVAVVQYEGQIGQSVNNLLARLGGHKATQTGADFFYSTIDKEDSIRLRLAYPKQFAEGAAQAKARSFQKKKKKK